MLWRVTLKLLLTRWQYPKDASRPDHLQSNSAQNTWITLRWALDGVNKDAYGVEIVVALWFPLFKTGIDSTCTGCG